MRIPVLDGPAEGVFVECPDMPQGFRPDWFRWAGAGPEEHVVYTPYRACFGDGTHQWVLALDKYSVYRYIVSVKERRARVWRVDGRTEDGEYVFHNHRTCETAHVFVDDFWRGTSKCGEQSEPMG